MKKVKSLILIFLIPFFGCDYSNPSTEAKKIKVQENQVFNSIFTHEEIAKYTVSALMGTNPDIIKSKKEGNTFKVWYNREDDGKYFDYKIRISGNKVVWGAYDGRWRETIYDEMISFQEIGNKLIIRQIFEDGSYSQNEYKK